MSTKQVQIHLKDIRIVYGITEGTLSGVSIKALIEEARQRGGTFYFPVLVTPYGEDFVLIFGLNHLHAARELKMEILSAVIWTPDEQEIESFPTNGPWPWIDALQVDAPQVEEEEDADEEEDEGDIWFDPDDDNDGEEYEDEEGNPYAED